ncbi:predicted protein [Naegleria gruberi]|uniref:Predicted protein n=1 Tax=Naegleria gruberi TaxID=5762 RepID=D2VGK0_NAEGR|nr:uncharacterized protein NAEGRDRAFT_68006 [Naegleria gruberi]EFC43978.1 predicted protein [Naegleria gruberi]|eukprot:XP_002676722.1 predicted protein [Naegleria gruberi strain NEG-M]
MFLESDNRSALFSEGSGVHGAELFSDSHSMFSGEFNSRQSGIMVSWENSSIVTVSNIYSSNEETVGEEQQHEEGTRISEKNYKLVNWNKLTSQQLVHIFSFLVGRVELCKEDEFYWNIVKHHLHVESEHDALLALFKLIPPKESVFPLHHLISEMNKRGKFQDSKFEEFYKMAYTHFEKILLLLRCTNFTNLVLAQGRISWFEREQLANMQRLIISRELGYLQPLKVGETVEQFDDEVELIDSDNDPAQSNDYLAELFRRRLCRLNLTKSDEEFISHQENGFMDLAFHKMMQLSEKMFRDFDMDCKDLALPYNFRNSHVKFEMDIFNTNSKKLGFCMDYNSSYQFEVEDEEEVEELVSNLSHYQVLDIRDVTHFSTFMNFEIPKEIEFVNFSGSIPYNYDLGQVYFPNVKFLRINIESNQSHTNDLGDEYFLDFEDSTSMFLNEFLKRFPNLIHLVIRGIENISFFEKLDELLSHLWVLELMIDDEDSFWGKPDSIECLERITDKAKNLKQLFLNVNLDVRRPLAVDYEKLKLYYSLGNNRFSTSIGRASIARFCKSAFANVYQTTRN